MHDGSVFGDIHDNMAAFALALYEMTSGDKERGEQTLCHLHDYLCTTRDIQSVVWLLPRVQAALQHAAGACL